ncbi:SusD/RagB family nutrient-binding outer membrane lipoprotein [Maribellus comscasis]|uniref:SusD/RagB family nutrient-binding outer membrane lipoprotein n=1 Tax=Maribellus comscasis TaxID=2681766 RepID=A0A6I6JKG0_9BACT|nr:SusD/RagB family nutrient-binding outer membrane lipoprotein [Maribellus comscasis]QGY43335.1 SusD/RagB family nutrient-binding outer membrane lipoprotein [Maribellus comscasis]
MKKYILSAILFVLIFSSCSDLEELNINPNNVPETHPQLLLTNIEWNAFQVEGVDPMFASRMVVQTDGENSNQFYNWTRAGFDDYDQLRNVTKMIEEAERIENTAYIALGKFFRAYYFFRLTLTFGDVPYSDALKGESEEVYTPAYVTQKEIFTGILNELKEADELLSDDNSIIEGDIIYDGSTTQWRKLINSFRLKILITLSKKVSDSDLNIESNFAGIYNNSSIIESNEDNGQLVFVDELGSRYTEYNSSSYGSARYMDSTFIKRLQDRHDPRLFIFCGQTRVAKETGLAINDFTAYEGGDPIAPYNDVNLKAADGLVSKVNLRYTTDPTTEPHTFIGYSEMELILAEASVRGWITTSAQEHYENAVKASFEFYNTNASDYADYVSETAAENYLQESLVDFSSATSDEEKLQLIMMQKYIPSFLQGGWRMYFDHLRTGYPEFRINEGLTPPTRWMYPTSEYQENSDNVTEAITSQFGSGNDKIRVTPWWLQ